jgi:hypothetical protein
MFMLRHGGVVHAPQEGDMALVHALQGIVDKEFL